MCLIPEFSSSGDNQALTSSRGGLTVVPADAGRPHRRRSRHAPSQHHRHLEVLGMREHVEDPRLRDHVAGHPVEVFRQSLGLFWFSAVRTLSETCPSERSTLMRRSYAIVPATARMTTTSFEGRSSE